MSDSTFKISWSAPIIPCKSLAGIPLHTSADLVESSLAEYIIDKQNNLYQFDNSPIFRLTKNEIDTEGDGGYKFFLLDDHIIDISNKALPALSIAIKNRKVFVIKVYNFSFPGDLAEDFIYKGALPGGLTLGSKVSDFLPLTDLEFDDGLGWFYTDSHYGQVEIGGWSASLEDQPDQIITSICILPAPAI